MKIAPVFLFIHFCNAFPNPFTSYEAKKQNIFASYPSFLNLNML